MVLVFTSMMVAYLGDQVLKFNLWVIGSLLVATGLALVVFNWTFVRRFYYTFFRDMRYVFWKYFKNFMLWQL